MGWFRKKRYEGYTVDLGRFKKPVEPAATPDSTTSAMSSDAGASFFGDLAGAAGLTSSNSASDSGSFSSTSSTSSLELHDKVDMLSNRILKLLDRIELLELKLSRLERNNTY